MKKRVLDKYGKGTPSGVANALSPYISRQAINNWHEPMKKREIDNLISALVRLGKPVPKWMLKEQ